MRHSPPRPDRTERGRDLSDKLFGSITLILHKIMFLKWRLSPAVAARRFHPRASIPPHQRPTGGDFDKRRTKAARNNFILLVLQSATHRLTIADVAHARTYNKEVSLEIGHSPIYSPSNFQCWQYTARQNSDNTIIETEWSKIQKRTSDGSAAALFPVHDRPSGDCKRKTILALMRHCPPRPLDATQRLKEKPQTSK